jgi:alpha-tubulin suppressor-like RCC1 family protein
MGDRVSVKQFEELPITLDVGYKIERVECGWEHTIVTAKNAQGEKKLYGCGRNHDGELGLGDRDNIQQFEALPINMAEGYHIERVECGGFHTIVLATNAEGERKLYGCGQNYYGQLGLGNRGHVNQFEELLITLDVGYQIEAVECGGSRTIVTAKNAEGGQKLYGCGWNEGGQLGMGGSRNIQQFEALPVNLAEGYRIERVECGDLYTIVTVKNAEGGQKLYGCGENYNGPYSMSSRCNIKQFEELSFREHILRRLVEKERQEEHSYNIQKKQSCNV